MLSFIKQLLERYCLIWMITNLLFSQHHINIIIINTHWHTEIWVYLWLLIWHNFTLPGITNFCKIQYVTCNGHAFFLMGFSTIPEMCQGVTSYYEQFYGDPVKCGKFYVCLGSQPMELQCPSKHSFSVSKGDCVVDSSCV